MKNKKKIKSFIYIYTLFFILCFSVITMAKYTGVISDGSSIPVAKWEVSLLGTDGEPLPNNKTLPTIIIGNSSTYPDYNLKVTSKSEVGVNYKLVISNVPTGLKVKIDDTREVGPTGSTIKVDLGHFSATNTEVTRNHKLTFIVPEGADPIDNRELNLDVIFEQVNPTS